MIALNNNKFHKFYYDCPLHNLFYFPLEYLQKPSSLLASFCISWDFLFNALTFGNNLKFLFFSALSESLRNSAWMFLLILMPSAIESFTSSISLLMMAECIVCFVSVVILSLLRTFGIFVDNISLISTHLVIENGCGKTMTVHRQQSIFRK